MSGMESASCRNYRGHLIIRQKVAFGRSRFDVWRHGQRLGRFKDDIAAELHIDRVLRGA